MRGLLFILTSVVIWAGWMVVTKQARNQGLQAGDIAALRFLVAGILLLPIVIRKGLRIGPYGIAGSFLLMATLGAPYTLVMAKGAQFAPASHAGGFVNGTMVFVSFFSGLFLLKEKFTLQRAMGTLLILFGLATLFLPSVLGSNRSMLPGHLLFILGGSMWAIYGTLLKAWKVDALHSTAVVAVLSMVIFVPIYLIWLPSSIGQLPVKIILFHGFYQGALASGLALFCFARAVEILGVSTTSSFLPLVPALTMIMGAFWLKEFPGTLELLGLGVLMLGLGVVAFGLRMQSRAQSIDSLKPQTSAKGADDLSRECIC